VRYSSISAIGAFTALAPASTDWLALDPRRCSGGAGPSLRAYYEDVPGGDGVLVYDALDGAQIVTLAGDLIITSAGDEAGYLAAIDTLYGSLASALATGKTGDITLTHSGGSLSCRYYSAIDHGWDGAVKSVTFGLIVNA
jgi:hypothetical protein